MFKIFLLSLALTGLQALPISRSQTKTHHNLPSGVQDGLPVPLPEDFRQGTEPSRRFIVDLNTGLVQDYISEMDRRTGLLLPSLGNGYGEMDRRHWFTESTVEEVPVQKNGGGWVRVEGRATLPDGFRQGTEPSLGIAEGFRQGTERFMPIPDGFRQGTEPSLGTQRGFRQGTERFMPIPDGFRQGTEPSLGIQRGFRQGTERFMPISDGFRQGTEPSLGVRAGFRQGTEPTDPIAYREVAEKVKTIPDGFRQGTEPSSHIPEGFRQGTERFMPIPEGFRQGTEPSLSIPKGFRQGTERFMPLSDGFRQGTEPSQSIPNGFRQGTEPTNPIEYREIALPLNTDTFPDGFRQGTEPLNPLDHKDAALSNNIVEGFRPGVGPFMPVWDSDRQEAKLSNHVEDSFSNVIEASKARQEPHTTRCNGEVINGRCYTFNPSPLPFLEAQDLCKRFHPNAELASVTNEDLHSRLVSMVTNGGQQDPVLTWLGGTVKNQLASWLDGSEWRYSDWMPGQPNIHTIKPVCMEMFRMGETWWAAADCDLKRASICSYPVMG